jgi:hypothetical protein
MIPVQVCTDALQLGSGKPITTIRRTQRNRSISNCADGENALSLAHKGLTVLFRAAKVMSESGSLVGNPCE